MFMCVQTMAERRKPISTNMSRKKINKNENNIFKNKNCVVSLERRRRKRVKNVINNPEIWCVDISINKLA